MKKILIATHSYLAKGFKDCIELLTGDVDNIQTINAYVDDKDFTNEIEFFFENFDTSKEYIVFTDLYGGSVNQKLTTYKTEYDFHLITQFNLPVILEILLTQDELNTSNIEKILNDSNNQMKVINLSDIDNGDDELSDFL